MGANLQIAISFCIRDMLVHSESVCKINTKILPLVNLGFMFFYIRPFCCLHVYVRNMFQISSYPALLQLMMLCFSILVLKP